MHRVSKRLTGILHAEDDPATSEWMRFVGERWEFITETEINFNKNEKFIFGSPAAFPPIRLLRPIFPPEFIYPAVFALDSK